MAATSLCPKGFDAYARGASPTSPPTHRQDRARVPPHHGPARRQDRIGIPPHHQGPARSHDQKLLPPRCRCPIRGVVWGRRRRQRQRPTPNPSTPGLSLASAKSEQSPTLCLGHNNFEVKRLRRCCLLPVDAGVAGAADAAATAACPWLQSGYRG